MGKINLDEVSALEAAKAISQAVKKSEQVENHVKKVYSTLYSNKELNNVYGYGLISELKEIQDFADQQGKKLEKYEKAIRTGIDSLTQIDRSGKLVNGKRDWPKGMSPFMQMGISAGLWVGNHMGDDMTQMAELDDLFNSLPKSVQKLVKDLIKDLGLGDIKDAYDIVVDISKGDIRSLAKDIASSLKDGNVRFNPLGYDLNSMLSPNWLAIKADAVIKCLDLVFRKDSYVVKLTDEYDDRSFRYFKEGEYGLVLWTMLGSAVDVLGKGTIDVTCQLVSGIIDSVTRSVFKVSLSTFNEMLYEDLGWSPGHAFNYVSKKISDGSTSLFNGELIEKLLGKNVNTNVK